MEKFALLNLLKAIDGLKSLQPPEKEPSSAPAPANTSPKPSQNEDKDMPNFMYEALLRHESASNRIRNKK